MAITASLYFNEQSVTDFDAGYSQESLNDIDAAGAAAGQDNIDRDEPVASIPNATASTGLGNLATALKTWWTGTKAPAMGLNPADTIISDIVVTSVELVNTAASQYNTPVMVYRVKGSVKWQKTG